MTQLNDPYAYGARLTDPQPCAESPIQSRVSHAREAGLRVLRAIEELETRLEQVAPLELNKKEVLDKELPPSCAFEERLREIEYASLDAHSRLQSLLARLKL